MFGLTVNDRFLLYGEPCDMRKSFDGLSGLVTEHLGGNPRSGEVFVFINKRRDRIKLLAWQGSGFTLYYKRLESGTFELPHYDLAAGGIRLDYAQTVLLVDGLSLQNLQRRARYDAPQVVEISPTKPALASL